MKTKHHQKHMGDKKKEKPKKKKDKTKKEKTVFHKKSDAGKGDVPRRGITQNEWGKKWERIFRQRDIKNNENG
jgi:hypothetical protein